MKRVFAFLLIFFAAFSMEASPQVPPLSVRLYWIQAPRELRIFPTKEGARYRLCAACNFQDLPGAIRLRVVGKKVAFGSEGKLPEGSLIDTIEFAGSYRVKVPSHGEFPSDYTLEIHTSKNRLRLNLQVPLEDYVAAVLGGESSVFRSAESLQAMAVAVRSYAVHFRARHKAAPHNEDFDFCDTTHCQDFRLSALSSRLKAAASATRGEMLWFEGEPIAAFYHRHCGGVTENARHAWSGQKVPYLLKQSDRFCTAQGRAEWHTQIASGELSRALRAAGIRVPANFRSVSVVHRTPSGRVSRLKLEGESQSTLSASAFRLAVGRLLGWNRIRSDQYDVRQATYRNGGSRFVFNGYGAGHGVGLSQMGAAQRGEAGHGYRRILDFYYPGTALGFTAAGLTWHAMAGERVEILSTAPSPDRSLVPLAERLMRAAEAESGWSFPLRPQIRVYPSVSVFRNATGQPGWVAAVTRGRIIHLQPAAVLRAKGQLTSTLRHEIFHFLIEKRSGPGVPLWFREGVVLYLAGGRKPGGQQRTTGGLFGGPVKDLEKTIRQSRNREEMQRAYRAARLQVERWVAAYGEQTVLGWLEQGVPPQLLARVGKDGARRDGGGSPGSGRNVGGSRRPAQNRD